MIPLRAWPVVVIAIALLIAVCSKAKAADLPVGIDCQQVRQLVAEHGKARALAWAIERGYSFRLINQARKCLGIQSNT
jgi:hypothetical protein